MQKKTIIVGLIAVFVGVFLYNALTKVQPQEIENAPDWRTLEAAQQEAVTTDKLILVDVFEVGCKYCRAMEREVYPDSTVRAVLDAGYIPAKVDGNSDELITVNGEQIVSREWAQSKGVFVFPGTLILDAEGNVLKSRTGYMNVDELRRFLYR
jgi:thioredoxin-related protein